MYSTIIHYKINELLGFGVHQSEDPTDGVILGVAKSRTEVTFYHVVCTYLVYVKGYIINIKYNLIQLHSNLYIHRSSLKPFRRIFGG